MAMKQFGGVTGDTSGFFLQICELAALAGVCLGGLV
jgi:adenosylcobinamide-GDP ribazoletransferase